MKNKKWLVSLVYFGLMTENADAMLADDCREVRIPRIRDDIKPVFHAPKQDAQTLLDQFESGQLESLGDALPILPECDYMLYDPFKFQDGSYMGWPYDTSLERKDSGNILADGLPSEATPNDASQERSDSGNIPTDAWPSNATADQVISDANRILLNVQALMRDCNTEIACSGINHVRANTFKGRINSRREAYLAFAEGIQMVLATMIGIKESWQSIKPRIHVADTQYNPDNAYAQLESDASEILNALFTEAPTQPDVISQIIKFAETVKKVSERAKSRAYDYNRNIRRRKSFRS
jgi:hypothetical protein